MDAHLIYKDSAFKVVGMARGVSSPSQDYQDRLKVNLAREYGVESAQVFIIECAEDLFGTPHEELFVVSSNGIPSGISLDPSWQDTPTIYLHISLSGGDGDADVLGVNLDGSNPIHVVGTLREGSDSASPVVEAVSGTWRVQLRDQAGGIYDIVQVTMTAGVAEMDYTPATNLRPALVHMDEADLIRVEGYTVRLANPVEMKVYRTLAA